MDLLIRLSANVDGIEAPGIDSPGSPLFLSCYQQHNAGPTWVRVELVCTIALLLINVTTTTTTMSCTVAPNLVPPVSCICLKLQHESARGAPPNPDELRA